MNKHLFKFMSAFALLFVGLFALTARVDAATECRYQATTSDNNKYNASFTIGTEIRQDGTYYKPNSFQLWVNYSTSKTTHFITPTIQSTNIKDNKCPDVVLYYVGQDNKENVIIGNESDISDIMNHATNLPTRILLRSTTNSKPSEKPDDSTTNNNNKNNSASYELNYSGSPCENETIKDTVKVVGKVISIIQIAVPIILIIMALVDIAKSIISMDDSKSRKSVNHLIKRIISAVLVFFIIAIVRFICGIVSNNSVDEDCMSLISDPWKK